MVIIGIICLLAALITIIVAIDEPEVFPITVLLIFLACGAIWYDLSSPIEEILADTYVSNVIETSGFKATFFEPYKIEKYRVKCTRPLCISTYKYAFKVSRLESNN